LGYSAMSGLDDTAFCEWLIEHKGVAAIPLAPFVTRPLVDGGVIAG
jgi:methionine transaminase